jgi:anti-sigma-K factor RskA
MASYDDDHDALAAEYVLGTLSAEERDQAETLISLDSGFAASVRQWERRLGELNVMVEAVEPRPEVWDRIKSGIAAAPPSGEATLPAEAGPTAGLSPLEVLDAKLLRAAADLQAPAPETSPTPAEARMPPADVHTPPAEVHMPPAEVHMPPAETWTPPPLETPTWATEPPELAEEPSLPADAPQRAERADVIYLARRVRRWRRLALTVGAIAALLAVYVAVWQVAPELIPPRLQPQGAGLLARHDAAPAPGRQQQDRLVAVLQQDPTAPAFLLTLDTQNRTLVMRRVSATPEAGRSYELWLISNRFSAPRSLGLVSNDEFTQHALPANYDADTLRGASYAVSLEPAGGSPSGVPTGPVLFTGKAVESLPAAAAPRT